jgi:hypothetical protein
MPVPRYAQFNVRNQETHVEFDVDDGGSPITNVELSVNGGAFICYA